MGEVLSQDEVTQKLAAYREHENLHSGRQSKIVSTNGCFDLLHVGHLRYLQQARHLGDKLIIALNTDASVKRLKGDSRPILPESERAELLAGLDCVDWVVLFDEDTPDNILRKIKPDIHVKGGDYTEESLPETPVLKEVGAEIKFLPFIEGRSTSSIIDKIQALPPEG